MMCGLGFRLIAPCALKPDLSLAARSAGAVEFSLGLTQRARLPAALRSGVNAIALVELRNGLGQCLVFFKLTAVLLELAKRFGHIAEQFRRNAGLAFATAREAESTSCKPRGVLISA